MDVVQIRCRRLLPSALKQKVRGRAVLISSTPKGFTTAVIPLCLMAESHRDASLLPMAPCTCLWTNSRALRASKFYPPGSCSLIWSPTWASGKICVGAGVRAHRKLARAADAAVLHLGTKFSYFSMLYFRIKFLGHLWHPHHLALLKLSPVCYLGILWFSIAGLELEKIWYTMWWDLHPSLGTAILCLWFASTLLNSSSSQHAFELMLAVECSSLLWEARKELRGRVAVGTGTGLSPEHRAHVIAQDSKYLRHHVQMELWKGVKPCS